MMRQRGSSLLEVLVAAAIGVVVATAVRHRVVRFAGHALRRGRRSVRRGSTGVLRRWPIVRGRPWRKCRLHAERWHQPSGNVRRDHRGEPALTRQAFRRRIFGSLVDQRGSTLVMGLMLVFIMTLLGVAIFDIARLEARLKLDSQTGVQALEIAEAGLERGLHLFFLQFVCGPTTSGPGMSPITPANCAKPPTGPNPAGPNYITETCLGAGGPGCPARVALTTACPAA